MLTDAENVRLENHICFDVQWNNLERQISAKQYTHIFPLG